MKKDEKKNKKKIIKKDFNSTVLGKVFTVSLVFSIIYVCLGFILGITEVIIDIATISSKYLRTISNIRKILLTDYAINMIYIIALYNIYSKISTNEIKESKDKSKFENGLIKFLKNPIIKFLSGLFVYGCVIGTLYKFGYELGTLFYFLLN